MVTFAQVADVFNKIEGISSRNEMVAITADFFHQLDSQYAQIFAYLVQGRIAPMFISSETQLSDKLVSQVFSTVSKGAGSNIDVESELSKLGDIGLVAELIASNCYKKKSPAIGLNEFYEKLWELVQISGTGSVGSKSTGFSELLMRMSPVEAKYFSRIVVGNLRLGMSNKTLLDALSVAAVGDKSLRGELVNAFGITSDIGLIASLVVINKDVEALRIQLSDLNVTPGIPLASRLVERVQTFEEVPERLGDEFFLQPKYDGLRCQIHKGVRYEKSVSSELVWKKYADISVTQGSLGLFDDPVSEVKLFSRNLNDISGMFPEIVEAVGGWYFESVILDGEIVGWDGDKYIPFQETMARKRKYSVKEFIENVPVVVFAFDILYLNGKSLVNVDLDERMRLLESMSDEISSKVTKLSPNVVVTNLEALDDEFERYVGKGLEGVIVKQFKGAYQPGVRNYEWIKLKKSMKAGLVDSVDAVVMGYYYGTGRKTEFGIGAILVGLFNSETALYESVSKVGTGITDDELKRIKQKLDSISVKEKPVNYLVARELSPDVWVDPSIVVTVEADEVTKSKLHYAARDVFGDYGLALRFPRLIEFDRDKSPEDSTSPEELVSMKK